MEGGGWRVEGGGLRVEGAGLRVSDLVHAEVASVDAAHLTPQLIGCLVLVLQRSGCTCLREVEVQMYASATWVQMDLNLIALKPSYVDLIDLKPSCSSTNLLMDSFSGPFLMGLR